MRKNKAINIRVSDDTLKEIKQRAASYNMNTSEYIVFTALNFNICEQLNKTEVGLSEQLENIKAEIKKL